MNEGTASRPPSSTFTTDDSWPAMDLSGAVITWIEWIESEVTRESTAASTSRTRRRDIHDRRRARSGPATEPVDHQVGQPGEQKASSLLAGSPSAPFATTTGRENRP